MLRAQLLPCTRFVKACFLDQYLFIVIKEKKIFNTSGNLFHEKTKLLKILNLSGLTKVKSCIT